MLYFSGLIVLQFSDSNPHSYLSQEQDKRDAEEALRKSKIKVTAAVGGRKPPAVPRKNIKKPVKPEIVADSIDTSNSTTATGIKLFLRIISCLRSFLFFNITLMSALTENLAEVEKPKAKAALKKAPAKKVNCLKILIELIVSFINLLYHLTN